MFINGQFLLNDNPISSPASPLPLLSSTTDTGIAMNYTTRTKYNSRSGVTLLFTISMIVLFLLMGTTFVVVANDYFKTAVRRSRVNTLMVDSTGFLDRALYDLLRGPSLRDTSSPLRGQSLLEDQYGYGFTTTLTNALAGPIDELKTLVIKNPADSTVPPTLFLMRGNGTTTDPADAFDWTTYVNGLFNGQVVTISAGVGGATYSTRIVSHVLVNLGASGGPDDFELRVVVPTGNRGIRWTGANSVASQAALGNVEVILNGRDFSGFGAGDVTGAPDFDFDFAGTLAPLLGANALQPNRIGEAFATLIGPGGYLESNNSPNESYDIPGPQNMFLSGVVPGGTPTAPLFQPSFGSDRLHVDQVAAGDAPESIRRASFRPVFVEDTTSTIVPRPPLLGSTASVAFGNFDNNGTLSMTDVNMTSGLDVDSDGDGVNDAVWIDIGLPLQTDSQGRKFRTLVAYRVMDMDGRLNINAHGSYADQALGTVARRGSSYGVAEISLETVVGAGNYLTLLNNRSGLGEPLPVPGNAGNALGITQNLFGHIDTTVVAGNLFATGSDLFGRSVIERGTTTFGEESLPEFLPATTTLSGAATISAYAADLGLGGGVGDSLFQAFELEPLLRSNDIDNSLLSSRLQGLGALASNFNAITTDSAEIAMPPVSVMEMLRDAVAADGGSVDVIVGIGYLSNDVLMGGKFDLNQITGDGVDNDGDNIVDDPQELGSVEQLAGRQNNLPFDLDNGGNDEAGDEIARQRKATQLYTLAMLVIGRTPPAYMTVSGTPAMTTAEYRRAVAQWAINVVDFSDADSIRTAFEYDINPFNGTYVDGDPSTTTHRVLGTAEGGDSDIVFGAERPEIVFNEVSATHDRSNVDSGADSGGGDDLAGGDLDWDSGFIPVTSTFIELYNPWAQTDVVNTGPATGFQVNPAELDVDQEGVDLSMLAPGDSPVWRIGVRRTDDVSMPFLRGIFFTDPTAAPSGVMFPNDNFFPSYTLAAGGAAPVHKVLPGGYFVVGSSGNVGGEHRVTYGRLNSNIPAVDDTRSVSLDNSTTPGVTVREWDAVAGAVTPSTVSCGVAVIDMPRSLSLSDPDGGYDPIVNSIIAVDPTIVRDDSVEDGTSIVPPLDTPLDTNADALDQAAIWNNGVTDGFRFLYLQRLADPTQAFDSTVNPYITIDVAKVDLLAFNGLENNPSNNTDVTDPTSERSATIVVQDGNTEFRTIERGEELAMSQDTDAARRISLRTENGNTVTADETDTSLVFAGTDGHNFSYAFNQTLGTLNASHLGTGSPVGWMTWNNRPFANVMELVHVPYCSTENLLNRFNFSRVTEDVAALTTSSVPEDVFSYYMSDDKFGHLIGYGGMSPVADGAGESALGATTIIRRAPTYANRFDRLLDFVSVPSRFLGSKEFLSTELGASTIDGLAFPLIAPYNTLPNFREPGKVNINTVSNSIVHEGIRGGFAGSFAMFSDFETARQMPNGAVSGPTNFEGRFISSSSSQYVTADPLPNGAANLFRRDAANIRVFDFESTDPATNTETSSWFENEYRQRLSSVTTTRSSVFSIWITIGYFEVDEFGRVGAELGSDEGQVRRNRAFYMVDRSIPVACEPGKNHNVDETILVRTIIE